MTATHFDAVAEDPTLAPPDPDFSDLTWADFCDAVVRLPCSDQAQLALVHIAVLAEGRAGHVVDLDTLAGVMGKKPGTLPTYLAELHALDWLDASPVRVPGKRRWVTGWTLARNIA